MQGENAPSGDSRVRFHYIKSNSFRVVHVDGALGGITPPGFIHCAIYSERAAIPQIAEYPLVEGALGQAEIIEGKSGIVREIDADLIMSRQAAEELRNWLSARIEEYDSLHNGRRQK